MKTINFKTTELGVYERFVYLYVSSNYDLSKPINLTKLATTLAIHKTCVGRVVKNINAYLGEIVIKNQKTK